MSQYRSEEGFSAVELLITLFVAAAFLIAGYTLSSFIMMDSADTRAKHKATTIGREYLERYSSLVGACEEAEIVEDLSGNGEEIEGLSDVTVTVEISCPNPTVELLHGVNVRVEYGQPTQHVTVAGYGIGT